MDADAPSPRVLVVYDQGGYARALADAISETLGHQTEVAETGDEALRRATVFKPEVVLLDAHMRQSAGEPSSYAVGRRLLQELRSTQPDLAVLIITWEHTPFILWDCVRRNEAAGVISANESLERICRAVENAAEIGRFVTADDERVLREMDALRMTDRKERILRLHFEGLTAQQIAQELGVATATIQDALQTLYDSFTVNSGRELLKKAHDLGFFYR